MQALAATKSLFFQYPKTIAAVTLTGNVNIDSPDRVCEENKMITCMITTDDVAAIL